MPENAFARRVVEEIDAGPICIKCIATTRGLTRSAVEAAVATVRRAFVIDSRQPCRVCSMRDALAFDQPGGSGVILRDPPARRGKSARRAEDIAEIIDLIEERQRRGR